MDVSVAVRESADGVLDVVVSGWLLLVFSRRRRCDACASCARVGRPLIESGPKSVLVSRSRAGGMPDKIWAWSRPWPRLFRWQSRCCSGGVDPDIRPGRGLDSDPGSVCGPNTGNDEDEAAEEDDDGGSLVKESAESGVAKGGGL